MPFRNPLGKPSGRNTLAGDTLHDSVQASAILVWAVGCLLVAGCGGGLGVDVVPVDVTVNYQGKPLQGATVMFTAVNGVSLSAGGLATGITDPNGKPTITTQVTAKLAGEGVVPGSYKVTILKSVPPDGLSEEAFASIVDRAIAETRAGTVDPNRDFPTRVEMLPAKFSNVQETTLKASVTEEGENKFVFDLQSDPLK